MVDRIIGMAIERRWLMLALVLAFTAFGVYRIIVAALFWMLVVR